MSDVLYFDAVSNVCAALCTRGVYLGAEGRSVGPWTPAVPDDFTWAVLGLQGQPIFLAHDAFEVAIAFCRLEAGEMDEGDAYCARRDDFLVEMDRYEHWSTTYQFAPFGDRNYEPPIPRSR